MATKIFPIDDFSVELAGSIIKYGGVVAFPTETVYGLGASAFNDMAVQKIFEIKGRPQDNPLIVHVHPDYDITAITDYIPDYAVRLAERYLPGPLTMVYRSTGKVSPLVSCGLDTLAVRIPSHEGAQKFLRYVDVPVAAPSANISSHVSPVTAEHVYNDLNGKIECILDGGKCQGGIESTVLDCTGDVPVILRPGLVTKEMIEDVCGICRVSGPAGGGEKVMSPGMKYRHYAPKCDAEMYPYEERKKALERYDALSSDGKKVFLLCCADEVPEAAGRNIFDLGKDAGEMARNLYALLREAEKCADVLIAVAPSERGGAAEGVMNRLTKACRGRE